MTATCPACGRPLPTGDPVVGTCPACGAEVGSPTGPAADAPAAEASSVRPPDRSARDLPGSDPLDGWDLGPVDSPPMPGPGPGDGAVVIGVATLGVLVGAAVSRRRLPGALLGAVAGALAAIVARRSWELEPPDDAWVNAVKD